MITIPMMEVGLWRKRRSPVGHITAAVAKAAKISVEACLKHPARPLAPGELYDLVLSSFIKEINSRLIDLSPQKQLMV